MQTVPPLSLKRAVAFVFLLAALAGAFIVGYIARGHRLAALSAKPTAEQKQWLFEGMVPLKAEDSVTFNSEALFESDIPLPTIESFQANVKFIEPPSDPSGSKRVIAYIARIRIASLEKKDIPAKYLREVVEHHKAGPITRLPIDQVTYVAKLKFDLIDRDGFNLLEITGPEEWLRSRTTNVLQHVTVTPVSVAVANRIAGIRPHLYVIRCESCRAA